MLEKRIRAYREIGYESVAWSIAPLCHSAHGLLLTRNHWGRSRARPAHGAHGAYDEPHGFRRLLLRQRLHISYPLPTSSRFGNGRGVGGRNHVACTGDDDRRSAEGSGQLPRDLSAASTLPVASDAPHDPATRAMPCHTWLPSDARLERARGGSKAAVRELKRDLSIRRSGLHGLCPIYRPLLTSGGSRVEGVVGQRRREVRRSGRSHPNSRRNALAGDQRIDGLRRIGFPPGIEALTVSEPHGSTATRRLSSELHRAGDLCQTTSKVARATAKYSSRRCQSYAYDVARQSPAQGSLSKKR
jgi:hypothetical protein